jgi:hypothetical protein
MPHLVEPHPGIQCQAIGELPFVRDIDAVYGVSFSTYIGQSSARMGLLERVLNPAGLIEGRSFWLAVD